MLENAHELYKINKYNTSEFSGPSLYEALDRYKKYERKLKDTIKPTEDTLLKLTGSSNHHHNQQQRLKSAAAATANNPNVLKSNFTIFPNGQKDFTGGGDSSLNMGEELSAGNSVASPIGKSASNSRATVRNSRPVLQNPYLRKQLPALSNGNGRYKSAAAVRQSDKTKNAHVSRTRSAKVNANNNYENDFDEQSDVYDQAEDEDEIELYNDVNVVSAPNYKKYMDDAMPKKSVKKSESESEPLVEAKLELETLLNNLRDGFYISRIQVRNAFSLYLYKIQLRLANEAQLKDDANVQQMDLVLRFIKKATPNLSQDFKVFIPSKRLPLSDQKRMLAKQLHDFLHIYRKDTEQIRCEISAQLENEKRKHSSDNNSVDERAFQDLLHRCSEVQLEEIMSAYMKKSQDSSVFLGGPAKKSSSSSTNNDNNDLFSPVATTAQPTPVSESSVTDAAVKPVEVPALVLPGHKSVFGNNNRLASAKKNKVYLSKIHKKDGRKSSKKVLDSNNNNGSVANKNVSGEEEDNLSIKSDYSSLSDVSLNKAGLKSASKLKRKSANRTKSFNLGKSMNYETTITNIYLNASPSAKGNLPRGVPNGRTKLNVSNKLNNTAPVNKFNFMTVENGSNNNGSHQKTDFVYQDLANSRQNRPFTSVNSSASQKNTKKQISLDYSPSNSMSEIQNDQIDHSVLVNGIKNLSIKQQERIYSAAKSTFVLGVSENGSNYVNSENAVNVVDYEPERYPLRKNSSTLLEHLEKQKEETSKLLELSRAKQNEMIAIMPVSYSTHHQQFTNSSLNNGTNTSNMLRPKN